MALKEKCFTFTWILENISYSLQKQDDSINSPMFVVDSIDESKWYLSLYPRGDERSPDYMAFYLFKEEDNEGPTGVEIVYELAFVSDDGSRLTTWDPVVFNSAFTLHGFTYFVKREDVFITKRSTFLPNDTLTARCRMWKTCGEVTEDVSCFARTRVGVQKISFLWDIKNFSAMRYEKKYTYDVKSLAGVKQVVSVEISLEEELSSKYVFLVKLSLQDQNTKFVTLLLSLVESTGNRIECIQKEFWFDNPLKTEKFTAVFSKKTIETMKNSYLPDDILSLNWEWGFSKGVISGEIVEVQYPGANYESKFFDDQNLNYQRVTAQAYSFSGHLKSLLDENFLCDVKLKTNTREFNAHKIILSASSDVFKAMFSNDMKEKVSNCVNIEDLGDDTVDELLVHVYTGQVKNLTWGRASQLYAAADKYAIFSLNDLCSSYMKDNVSPSNVCEVLLLSDFHADDDLKTAMQNYTLKNVKAAINSNGWKLLMETNAKLAAETLCLLHK